VRIEAIGGAEGHVRGEDMLLDLRRGLRVFCAHGCVGGAAGYVRDDAAAGRSRSSRLGRADGAIDGLGSDRHARQDTTKLSRRCVWRGMHLATTI
jgi:hypothetical protein